MSFNIKIITFFPELFPGPLNTSIMADGLKRNLWSCETINLKDFARYVDDTPYGGGNGMVIRADVLGNAMMMFDFTNPIIYLSPRGKLLNQKMAKELSDNYGLNIICGRFEGIDERVLESFNILEISIGDYIISNGDLAAYVLIDACLRHIDGIVSDEANEEESFNINNKCLLEYPQYTKPLIWNDKKVPDILLSGNHEKIRQWRLQQAEEKTKNIRADLWYKYRRNI
jgi:tRNA (guanine37-N1)-methyltransferase